MRTSPLVSIFSHLMSAARRPKEIHFLYSTKVGSEVDPNRILFLPRLMDLVSAAADPNVTLSLFLTDVCDGGVSEFERYPSNTFFRRIDENDLMTAVDGYQKSSSGPNQNRKNAVCYVCGPAKMTDEIVRFLKDQEGISGDRVLCEKWW